MQLTQQTDYAIRTLLYTNYHPDRLVTITEIANFYQISRSHLTKIVANLTQCGYLHGIRGKKGGLKLAKPAEEINIGALVAQFEPLQLVECFHEENNCVITSKCRLKFIIYEAKKAFLAVLNEYTLAEIALEALDRTESFNTIQLQLNNRNTTSPAS